MITHGNIVATAAAIKTLIPNPGRSDVYLAYLPLAHVLELAAEVCSYLYFSSLLNEQDCFNLLWLSSPSCCVQVVQLATVLR